MQRYQAAGGGGQQSPHGRAFRGDLLDQKSKSPLCPGGGAVVTNDYGITL